jgi:flagella synthesis protein FlgN
MTVMQYSAGALAAAVRSERISIQTLVDVLSVERQLLASGEIDRLEQTAVRKRELLLHISHLGDHRNRLLERAGVSADRHGMKALLDARDDAHEARSEWQSLLDVTQKAHRLNQENGLFIEAGMRSNQQALSVLVSAGSAGAYGPGGRTMNPRSSRTLASA